MRGVQAPGEVLPASHRQDGSTALAGMLGQWGTQKLMMYVVESVQFDLVVAQAGYTFPDGYEDALAYNLAYRLGHEWGVEVPAAIEKLARETLGNIKRVNQDLTVLRLDTAVHAPGSARGAYDIRSDN